MVLWSSQTSPQIFYPDYKKSNPCQPKSPTGDEYYIMNDYFFVGNLFVCAKNQENDPNYKGNKTEKKTCCCLNFHFPSLSFP